MIWGASCKKETSELAFVAVKQNAKMYTETLQKYVLHFVEKFYPGT